MKRSKGGNFSVMQLQVTYYPLWFKDKDLPYMAEEFDGYYSPILENDKDILKTWTDESWMRHFIPLKDDVFKVAYPFIVWEVRGFTGINFGPDDSSCDAERELYELGKEYWFEGWHKVIWNIAIPLIKQSYYARDYDYSGRRTRRPPLSQLYKLKWFQPLQIGIPLVWSVEYSYDDYTHESDMEWWLEGELMTHLLGQIVERNMCVNCERHAERLRQEQRDKVNAEIEERMKKYRDRA